VNNTNTDRELYIPSFEIVPRDKLTVVKVMGFTFTHVVILIVKYARSL